MAPQYCFTTGSGEQVFLFTLVNEKGSSVTITNYGAIITSFNIRRSDGSLQDIVLGFDKVEDYLLPEYLAGYPYFGAAIGRYANRIANAAFSIDGKKYTISNNKENCQLHGGYAGFDKKTWHVQSSSNNTLVLTYKSIDGEEGYPGTLDVTVRFEWKDNNEFVYEYTAVTNKTTAVNLTHHSYFNLDKEIGSVAAHKVRLNADRWLEQDAGFIVTGKMLDVKNTIYDFTATKKAGTDWIAGEGYDQSFVISKEAGLGLAAMATGSSGLTLEVFTTEPLVHFYTGKWIPLINGKKQQQYGPYTGLCFETQKHPNAVNIPSFPDTLLRPGETYHTSTVYRISGA